MAGGATDGRIAAAGLVDDAPPRPLQISHYRKYNKNDVHNGDANADDCTAVDSPGRTNPRL